MDVRLSTEERAAVAAARAQERRVRVWRRYRALDCWRRGSRQRR